MGAFLKVMAKGWFFSWSLTAVIALLTGHFLMCFAVLGGAAITSCALWLFGDHLERKTDVSRSPVRGDHVPVARPDHLRSRGDQYSLDMDALRLQKRPRPDLERGRSLRKGL